MSNQFLYKNIVAAIKERAQTTDEYYRFVYYQGAYFGVSLDTKTFQGNIYKAMLDFHDYVLENAVHPMGKGKKIEFLRDQFEITEDAMVDEDRTVDRFLELMVENLKENDTLWIEITEKPKQGIILYKPKYEYVIAILCYAMRIDEKVKEVMEEETEGVEVMAVYHNKKVVFGDDGKVGKLAIEVLGEDEDSNDTDTFILFKCSIDVFEVVHSVEAGDFCACVSLCGLQYATHGEVGFAIVYIDAESG